MFFFNFSIVGGLGSDDNNGDIEMDFKCDKCDSNEGVISNQKETTTTILKDNAKPILKFSVSAILGDKKECARVRHGKRFNLICNLLPLTCLFYNFKFPNYKLRGNGHDQIN